MAFPVRSNLFRNGTYYCDWRVWVQNCDESSFFLTAVAVNAAIHLFCMLGYGRLTAYRVRLTPFYPLHTPQGATLRHPNTPHPNKL